MLSATITGKPFSVAFTWHGIPACAKTSPEFQLSGVPTEARQLRFVMTDLDVPMFRHGGSTIPYRGDVVPRGAIRYIGPCPPRGERHRYRWTVQALNGMSRVLATATATAVFPL